MGESKRKRQPQRRGRREPHSHAELTDSELEAHELVAEIERRAQEALAPDTPPERIAALLLESFPELPSPLGFTLRLQREGGRAVGVAAELERRAPGSVTALTFAAEIAWALDGDLGRASRLLDKALEACVDPGGYPSLAEHLLAVERYADALALLEESLIDEPEEADAQEVLAEVLSQIHGRAAGGEELEPVERAALTRFADRGPLYRMRKALVGYVDAHPKLEREISADAHEWLGALGEELTGAAQSDPRPGGPSAARLDAVMRLAVEHAWLLQQEDDGDQASATGRDQALAPVDAPLALFAIDPDTPPELAKMAREWLQTCTYGIWQLTDPEPSPGVWLTDLLTGIRRYAAIAPEQLEGASRRSVLMGALVALDRTWRSASTLIPMRPAEGDRAAGLARMFTGELVEALSESRAQAGHAEQTVPDPHSPLVNELSSPVSADVADLMNKVLATIMPAIVADLWHRRDEQRPTSPPERDPPTAV